jgi:hypothetical protein
MSRARAHGFEREYEFLELLHASISWPGDQTISRFLLIFFPTFSIYYSISCAFKDRIRSDATI